MESLAVILEPYKSTISTTASAVTYLHHLSGAIVCNSIRKEKSTADRSIMPFVAGGIFGGLGLCFATILKDTTQILKGLVGSSLTVAYICCFLYYTNNPKDKKLARKQVTIASAFLAVVYAYRFIENPEVLRFRFGMLFTTVLFAFLTHPVITLFQNIRKKSSKGLPLPMILTTTVITFLWFLYGIVTRENFTILQNGFIFFLHVAQLSLFVIYPSKSNQSKKDTTETKNINNNDSKKTS